MKTKKTTFLFGFLLLVGFAHAQTWQWGKRGGTIDDTFDGNPDQWEQVVSMVTDSQDNVYVLTPIGMTEFNVDGNPRPTYGLFDGGGASLDYAISSFACDGTYRWSQTIGGQNTDEMKTLQIDAQDNIYVSGKVYNNYDDYFFPGTYPQIHFGDNMIIPYAVYDEENPTGNASLFVAKFDSNGNFLWLQWPQATNVSFVNRATVKSIDLQVDPQGNVFWLCFLTPDSYHNGALVTTQDGYYLLKYDAMGNYVGHSLMDLQVGGFYLALNFNMKRNHNTGVIYLSDFLYKDNENPQTLVVGGQSVEHSKFIAAFDSNGAFLWKRENNSTRYTSPFPMSIAFDAENNIYVSSGASTIGSNIDPNPIMESFNGVQFEAPSNFSNLPSPYIIKLDADGNTIWQTNGFNNIFHSFDIVVNGDEVGLVGGQRGMDWQTVSVPFANRGVDPYLARFNKETGTIIGIQTLVGVNGTDDFATAVRTDSQGNYLVGGRYWTGITIGPNALTNSGLQTDFFVAKFGASVCNLNTKETDFSALKAYPNPVSTALYLDNSTTLTYELYNLLGVKIAQGTLPPQGQINMDDKSAGIYLLQLENNNGDRKTIKLAKE